LLVFLEELVVVRVERFALLAMIVPCQCKTSGKYSARPNGSDEECCTRRAVMRAPVSCGSGGSSEELVAVVWVWQTPRDYDDGVTMASASTVNLEQ
jgi:hypothetical protein